MTEGRIHPGLWLLASGLAACGPSTDGATGGAHADEVDAAVAACGPYATQLVECYGTDQSDSGGYDDFNYLSALGYCIGYLGYAQAVGPACRDALEEQFACLSALDCEALVEDVGGDTGDPDALPCATERAAASMACNIDDGEPETTG